MTDKQLIFKVISALAILFPIALNILRIKTAGLFGRLFLLFLLVGFFTDMSLWYMYFHRGLGLSVHIFNFYSLCEALFFFWLIQYLTTSVILKSITRKLLFATLPLWIASFFIVPFFIKGESARSIPFDTSYEVIVSFLSGFALLHLAETSGDLLKNSSFWFLMAIFFYCFCTFFIMSLLGSYMALNLWPLANIINIATYVFYSIGLFNYRTPEANA